MRWADVCLLLAVECGGAVDPILDTSPTPAMDPPTDTPSAPVTCVASGVAYPSCDGLLHDYGVRYMNPDGTTWLCLHESDAGASEPCASGAECVVVLGDASVQRGACR